MCLGDVVKFWLFVILTNIHWEKRERVRVLVKGAKQQNDWPFLTTALRNMYITTAEEGSSSFPPHSSQ